MLNHEKPRKIDRNESRIPQSIDQRHVKGQAGRFLRNNKIKLQNSWYILKSKVKFTKNHHKMPTNLVDHLEFARHFFLLSILTESRF